MTTLTDSTVRTCTHCRETKAAAEFQASQSACRACHRAWGAARTERRTALIKAQTFGIEIEMQGLDRARAVQVIAAAIPGATVQTAYTYYGSYRAVMADGRAWLAVTDASINGNGVEVVSPILTWDDIPLLQDVVRALRRAGGRTDSSCGIHIHSGSDRLGAKGVANVARLASQNDALIRQMVGVLPARNVWCAATPVSVTEKLRGARVSSFDALARAWYAMVDGRGLYNPNGRGSDSETARRRSQKYDPSRYHGVNLHSVFHRGTVEFRYFNSTLHAGQVRAYVVFVLAMAARAAASKTALTSKTRGTDRQDAVAFLSWLGLNSRDEEFANPRKWLLAAWDGAPRG